MKLIKSYRKIIIMLAVGFALGALINYQFYTKFIVAAGWHTTISPPNPFSFDSLLLGMTILVLGMSVGNIVPYFRKYCTSERMELVTISLTIAGSISLAIGVWNIFEACYFNYIYEQYSFYSRAKIITPFVIMALSLILTQTLWISKIRGNSYCALIVVLIVIYAYWI